MARKAKGKRKSFKSRKEATIKKTRLTFQMVSAEIIEAEIILEDCIFEFNETFETGRRPQIVEPDEIEESDSVDMIESTPEEPEEEEEEKEEVEEIEEEVLERDKDLKDLFKKIALKTHPARLSDDDDEAASAVKGGDGMALLEIAYELGINVDIDPEKELEWLNRKIRMLQHKVTEMQNTAEWIWYHSDGAERVRVEMMVQGQLGFKIREPSSYDSSDE